MMRVVSSLSVPSTDKTESSNQDALYLANTPDNQTYCVVDGVSGGWNARDWARHVVRLAPLVRSDKEAFIQNFYKNLNEYEKDWEVKKSGILEKSKKDWTIPIAKVHGPNGASYCSVTFNNNEYKALAMGDSCLIHLNKDFHLKKSFPIARSSDFTNQLSVYSDASERGLRNPQNGLQEYSSRVNSGDVIILATDAIAQWILKILENGNLKLLREFLSISNDRKSIDKLIASERMGNGGLQDDDSTYIILEA